jgi:cell division GTPase FtsZ
MSDNNVKVKTEETVTVPQQTKLKSQLEKDVKLNVFVIGVGNAGNQTIVFGKKEGMNVFAINSSIKDLSDQIVDETIPSFIVGNEARGSGKNVEKGKALFKENGRDLFQVDTFIDSCQAADVIVVVSATGGGTGPSVSPEICRILTKMFPKKIVMYHGITPKNSDSNIAFSNTAYCLNEIKNLNIPYMLTDLEYFSDDANDTAFIKADKHVIECIKAVSGMYLNMSSSQMIDENDLKTIISEPGYLATYAVNGITSSMLEKKSMQSMLIEQIRKGPAMMIQKDGISMQMGVIINCPDDLSEVSRTGNYQEIFDFVGHRPKNGIFENYGVTNGTDGQMIVILSGMTYPVNRISYYIDTVKEQEEFLKKRKDIDISEDVAVVTSLVSNGQDKLSSNTSVSTKDISNVLDDFFS